MRTTPKIVERPPVPSYPQGRCRTHGTWHGGVHVDGRTHCINATYTIHYCARLQTTDCTAAAYDFDWCRCRCRGGAVCHCTTRTFHPLNDTPVASFLY